MFGLNWIRCVLLEWFLPYTHSYTRMLVQILMVKSFCITPINLWFEIPFCVEKIHQNRFVPLIVWYIFALNKCHSQIFPPFPLSPLFPPFHSHKKSNQLLWHFCPVSFRLLDNIEIYIGWVIILFNNFFKFLASVYQNLKILTVYV